MTRSLPLFGATAMLAACATSPPVVEPVRPWSCSPRLHLSSVWRHLSNKYDGNGDGVVTRAEYARGDQKFDTTTAMWMVG